MIKINGMVIEQNHFPDGTLLTKYKHDHNFPYAKIQWKYENDSELFTLICLVKHLREHFLVEDISLFMHYLPHARQDRVKKVEDIFTLKYFCEIINSLNFTKVQILDAHSNVSLALLDRVEEIQPWSYIDKARFEIYKTLDKQEELIHCYPDAGAFKRYSADLNIPFIYGNKQRDWATGAILGLEFSGPAKLTGANVLIIDDICSRGGTFYHAAKKLKEAGAANIYLYVTHCENTIHKGELLNSDLIKHIYTTDSILTKEHEKITIIE